MLVKSTLQDTYSLKFFELFEAYQIATGQDLQNNKKYYLIDHITEDYPPGYDYYFVDNNLEHLNSIGNAQKFIDNNSADLMLGSFLHAKHSLYNRTVTFPNDYVHCGILYTNSFYFTSSLFVDKPRDKNITFINGENRSYRNYFMKTVEQSCDLVFSKDTNVIKTECNSNSSTQDEYFAEYCNNLYRDQLSPVHTKSHVSYKTVSLGQNKGEVRLSYIPLDEYMTSRCIVYPETTFYNYELLPTEKTWKCVKAKTHWIMFSGAGSYELMRNLGYRSIVELCPSSINNFDDELDHVERIQKIAKCCEWIQNNPDVLTCTEADNILKKNYENFHEPAIMLKQAVKTFERYL